MNNETVIKLPEGMTPEQIAEFRKQYEEAMSLPAAHKVLLIKPPITDERLREVVSNIVGCLGIHTCTDEQAKSGDCPCGEAYYGRPDQAIAILRKLIEESRG